MQRTKGSGPGANERPPVANSSIGASWYYDPTEKILFASHPRPVELRTREDMTAYFEDGIRYWRRHCGGEKVYIVVDYENLTTNLDELDFYASQVKRVINECAITVVRYHGSLLQRMASRMTAIKLHTPSNAYSSREEALAIVRGLKAGTISMQPAPTSTP
ncbi:MAG: hypothetical protein ACOY0T_22360 [Myxococcota bacterium]